MNKIIKNFKNIKYGPAPEDDTEVINWIKKISSSNKNYINGKWNTSKGAKKIKVINPSTNKKLFTLLFRIFLFILGIVVIFIGLFLESI